METELTLKSWMEKEYALSNLRVKRIPFRESKEWYWNSDGFLAHQTNRFFNVIGVKYFCITHKNVLSQPIIDQSEIGLLSFLVFKDSQEWWILAHAKVEPGNVNGAQLAPTIQATKSNYEIAHGGFETPYLKIAQSNINPLYNQLQSEQNSRFLGKRNRNCTIRLDEKIEEEGSHFKWIPIGQLLRHLGDSHLINTDARSVLTCWLYTDADALRECLSPNPFSSLLFQSFNFPHVFYPDEDLDNWLKALNKKWCRKPEVISLNDLDPSWVCTDSEIYSPEYRSLIIYHIDVSCDKREVSHWDQPIAGSQSQSHIFLFIGTYKGTLHFLLQAKLEAGNRNGFELTTTVQADSCEISSQEQKYITMADKLGRQLLCFENSEEGGRFDQCISNYKIIWMDQVSQEQEDAFHRWVSLPQLSNFLRRENIITNELRSALSSLLSIENL